jgi:hypothetical protein
VAAQADPIQNVTGRFYIICIESDRQLRGMRHWLSVLRRHTKVLIPKPSFGEGFGKRNTSDIFQHLRV